MRAVGLFPLVVLTGCFVANPRWQGSGEDEADEADGTTGSPMGDDGPSATLGTDTTPPTTMPPDDTGPVDDEGETMVPVDWWDTAWQYRRRIEWATPDIGGQVADLPVQVEVYSLGLPNEFAEGGRDIRVVTDSGEVLSAEIDHWTEAFQEGVVWFRTPELNGSGPVVWLYHGNPDASDPGPANAGVFINDYVAVWHMQDNTDSTGKGHSIEASQQVPVEGYIGNALSLDPVAGGVPVSAGPALLGLSNSDFTFSAMVNAGDILEVGVLLEISEADYPLLRVSLDAELGVHVTRHQVGDGFPTYSATSEDTLIGGVWSHITVRHSVNSGTQIDIDGFSSAVVEDTMPGLPMLPQGEQIRVGASIDGSAAFTGRLDEVRVANVLRDDTWVLFENDAVDLGITVLGDLEERP